MGKRNKRKKNAGDRPSPLQYSKDAPPLTPERSMWAWVTSWAAVAIAFSILIGIGWGGLGMTPPEVKVALGCFAVGFLILLGKISWWVLTERTEPLWQRCVFICFAFAATGFLWFLSSVFALSKKPAPSPAQTAVIAQLESLVEGQNESSLGAAFGFPTMLRLNIDIVKARTAHFIQTGDASLSLVPYRNGGKREMLLDTEIGHMSGQGGMALYTPDPHEVALIVLPEEYSEGRKALARFAESSELPQSVTVAVKHLDDAVEANAKTLIKVLNEALKTNPDYFLHYDDFNSPYLHLIDSMYLSKFAPLKPRADDLRAAIREFLQIK